MAAGEGALLAGAALLIVGVRGLRFLPVQGPPAGPSAPRAVALAAGVTLVAATPVAVALVCRERAAVRVGLAALATGILSGVVWAVVIDADDLLPPVVFGIGVAAAIALPARSRRGIAATLAAAAACGACSLALSSLGWFDPLVVVVLPVVAAVDAWVADRPRGRAAGRA